MPQNQIITAQAAEAMAIRLIETAHRAPAMAKKALELDKARAYEMAFRKRKGLKGAALQMSKAVVLIEHDMAESMPPTPPAERGRGKTIKCPGAETFNSKDRSKMRAAYRGLTPASLEVLCDGLIEKGLTPSREYFLRLGQNHKIPNDEWYSPRPIVESARSVLGGTIGLDPASSEQAQKVVRAEHFFTKDRPFFDSGLPIELMDKPVFLNPPYSKEISQFIDWLWHKFHAQGYRAPAIVLTHSWTGTKWSEQLYELSDNICLVHERVNFTLPSGDTMKNKAGSIIFGHAVDSRAFKQAFSLFGTCYRKSM